MPRWLCWFTADCSCLVKNPTSNIGIVLTTNVQGGGLLKSSTQVEHEFWTTLYSWFTERALTVLYTFGAMPYMIHNMISFFKFKKESTKPSGKLHEDLNYLADGFEGGSIGLVSIEMGSNPWPVEMPLVTDVRTSCRRVDWIKEIICVMHNSLKCVRYSGHIHRAFSLSLTDALSLDTSYISADIDRSYFIPSRILRAK